MIDVYKELSDTQDLEDLENILGGQSHRAQLSALINNHGGQSYTKTVNKKDNFLKIAEMDRGRRHGPSRRSLHTGRGGGIVGTRGRQLAPVPPRYVFGVLTRQLLHKTNLEQCFGQNLQPGSYFEAGSLYR